MFDLGQKYELYNHLRNARVDFGVVAHLHHC